MSRRRGTVSPARAAKILGVHRNTVYEWARRAAAGEPSYFEDVTAHPITGYLSISLDEVLALKASASFS